jgi:hypothetical protein
VSPALYFFLVLTMGNQNCGFVRNSCVSMNDLERERAKFSQCHFKPVSASSPLSFVGCPHQNSESLRVLRRQ